MSAIASGRGAGWARDGPLTPSGWIRTRLWSRSRERRDGEPDPKTRGRHDALAATQ